MNSSMQNQVQANYMPLQTSMISDKPEEQYLYSRTGLTDYSALDTNLKLIQDMLKVPVDQGSTIMGDNNS